MQEAIYNQSVLDRNGYREPRVGEWHISATPISGRDLTPGSIYLRSDYPLIEAYYNSPSPGSQTLVISTSIPTSITSGGLVFSNGNTVFVARNVANATYYLSTDGGGTWSTIAHASFWGASNITLKHMTYGNGIWVAISDGGRIVKSTDNGATWTLVATGLGTIYGNTGIVDIIYSQDAFYVSQATSNSIVINKSTNDGATWTASLVSGSHPSSTVNPGGLLRTGSTKLICFWHYSNNIYYAVSIDNGSTWGTIGFLNGQSNGTQTNFLLINDKILYSISVGATVYPYTINQSLLTAGGGVVQTLAGATFGSYDGIRHIIHNNGWIVAAGPYNIAVYNFDFMTLGGSMSVDSMSGSLSRIAHSSDNGKVFMLNGEGAFNTISILNLEITNARFKLPNINAPAAPIRSNSNTQVLSYFFRAK